MTEQEIRADERERCKRYVIADLRFHLRSAGIDDELAALLVDAIARGLSAEARQP